MDSSDKNECQLKGNISVEKSKNKSKNKSENKNRNENKNENENKCSKWSSHMVQQTQEVNSRQRKVGNREVVHEMREIYLEVKQVKIYFQ